VTAICSLWVLRPEFIPCDPVTWVACEEHFGKAARTVDIAEGSIPGFFNEKKNITVVMVDLKGQNITLCLAETKEYSQVWILEVL
jgi:hypothetical protein